MDTVTEQITAPADTRAPSSPGLRDEFGPLLRLDPRDVAGLRWVKTRCQMWLTALKRRRRYGLPRGADYTPEESEAIEALTALENAAARLLLVQPSSLCPASETRLEHTRQGDAENSHAQLSHKFDQARTSP